MSPVRYLVAPLSISVGLAKIEARLVLEIEGPAPAKRPARRRPKKRTKR